MMLRKLTGKRFRLIHDREGNIVEEIETNPNSITYYDDECEGGHRGYQFSRKDDLENEKRIRRLVSKREVDDQMRFSV